MRVPADLLGGRNQDGVHDVHDAVGGGDVGGLDQGFLDGDEFASLGEGHIGAVDGFAVAVFDIGSHQLAGNDVVSQDCFEFGGVFAQLVHGLGGHFGKSLIGRGKHRV